MRMSQRLALDPIACPYCGGKGVTCTNDWVAQCVGAADVRMDVEEWHCSKCARSFWTAPTAPPTA